MMKSNIRFLTLVAIILGAAFSRVVPHMPNFSPMEAITLFAAAHFARTWQVFLIPFASMWLSSLFIDNVIYGGYQRGFVWMYPGFHWQYLGYFLIALMGLRIFRNGTSFLKVAGGGLAAGVIFFLVSNFGVWMRDSLYPQNFAGLVACYTAAIPFYRGTLLGDLFYTTLLFGGFALLRHRFPGLRAAVS
jgi:hypothetical protein